MQRLDSLLIDTRFPDRRLMRTVGNMLMVELWERAGDQQRALAANRPRDVMLVSTMLAAPRSRREARFSEQLGRPRDASA